MLQIPGLARTLNYGQPINRQSPLNRGLVLWLLSLPAGGKGNTFPDLCGRNHGTLTNGPTREGARGRPGGFSSLLLDGSDDFVNCGSGASLNFGAASFSLFVWVRTTQTGTVMILNHTTGAGTDGYELYFGDGGDTGTLNFRFNSIATEQAKTSTAWNDGIWHHVAAVRNAETSSAYVYIDGNQEASSSFSGATSVSNASALFQIGARQGSLNYGGSVDCVQVFNRALDLNEVRSLYQDSRRGYPTTLNWYRPRFYFDVGGGGGGGASAPMAIFRRPMRFFKQMR